MQSTFPRLMLEHATARPDAAALREKSYGIWQTTTWAQLAVLVRQLACGFAQAGMKRDDHVVVVGDNRPRLYASMLAVQALVSVGLILLVDDLPIKPEYIGLYQGAAVACGLMISLGLGSVIKARFLSQLLGQQIRVWRWALLSAVAASALLGVAIVSVPARFEWVELTLGIPAILGLYGWIIWRWGFGPEDRVLFRKKRD